MKKRISFVIALALLTGLAACTAFGGSLPPVPGPGNGPNDAGCPTPIGGGPTPVSCDDTTAGSGCPTPIGGGPTPISCDGSTSDSGCPTPIGGGPTPISCDGSTSGSGCPTPIGGGPTPISCDGSTSGSGCPTPIGGGPTPISCDGSTSDSGCPTPIGGGPTPISCDDMGQPLTFAPNINAYCRSGPDPVFNSIGLAMKDQVYPIDGRNSSSTWYRIMLSSSAGCWVPVEAGTASGDISLLRVLFDVLTPTHTYTPAPNCSSFTDAVSCNAQTACQWKIPLNSGRGYCTNK